MWCSHSEWKALISSYTRCVSSSMLLLVRNWRFLWLAIRVGVSSLLTFGLSPSPVWHKHAVTHAYTLTFRANSRSGKNYKNVHKLWFYRSWDREKRCSLFVNVPNTKVHQEQMVVTTELQPCLFSSAQNVMPTYVDAGPGRIMTET